MYLSYALGISNISYFKIVPLLLEKVGEKVKSFAWFHCLFQEGRKS